MASDYPSDSESAKKSRKRRKKDHAAYTPSSVAIQSHSFPPEMPDRLRRSICGGGGKFVIADLSESEKTILTHCAILAMQDHAIQDQDYCEGLRFLTLLKARYVRGNGLIYSITFQGESDKYGKTTYKADVCNNVAFTQVMHVTTTDPCNSKWYTGTLCVPEYGLTIDTPEPNHLDSLSSQPDVPARTGSDWSKITPELPEKAGRKDSIQHGKGRDKKNGKKAIAVRAEDKLVLDDSSESYEAIVRDCAILAMQDHSNQDMNFGDLRFIKVVEERTSFVDGYIYSITFEGASVRHGKAVYEADVWDAAIQRKVGRVRIINPSKGQWYTGVLCIPKVTCKRE